LGWIDKNPSMTLTKLKILTFFLCFCCISHSQGFDYVAEKNEFTHLFEKANFTEAAILAREVYDFAILENNTQEQARFGTLLTEAYMALNYFDETERHLKEALEIQQKNNDSIICRTYLAYGIFHLGKKNLDLANLYFNTAIDSTVRLPSKYFKAKAYIYLGILDEHRELPQEALKRYEFSLKTFEKHKNGYEINYAKAKLAGAHLKVGNLETAYELSREVLNFALQENYIMLSSMAYKRLSDYYEAIKDTEKTLLYLKKHQEEKDKILFSNQYQFFPLKKSENSQYYSEIIDRLKAGQAADAKTIRNLYLITFMGLALIIVLAFLTRTFYRNNNLRLRSNELLRIKNQQLEVAKNKAEDIASIRERFISTISHELRTPLYAVTGISHLLFNDNPKPEQLENLESLRYSGEYLLALVNDILEINRLDSDKATVDFNQFEIRTTLQQVIQSFQETAKKNNTKLILEIDPNLPEKIVTDEVKFNQVIVNLIGNAVKFTEDGTVWVRIKQNWQKDTAVNFTFEVQDTGIGIEEKHLENIFDNFSQGDTEINKKFGGTGLGLAIVKRILAVMDSEISVKSKLGEGSTFYFDLTAKLSNGEDGQEITHFDLEKLKGKKLLIVEDNKINQMITRKIVESVGISCEVVDNGTKAVEMVKYRKYDGVLMDIHMPGISGIEATRYIRIFNTAIPIIALTALSLSEKRQELLACGMDEIINKPFKPDEFYRKLFKLLV